MPEKKKPSAAELVTLRDRLMNSAKLSGPIYDALRRAPELDGQKSVDVAMACAFAAGRIARELGLPAASMGLALAIVDDCEALFDPLNRAAAAFGEALATGDGDKIGKAYQKLVAAQKKVGEALRAGEPDDFPTIASMKDRMMESIKKADSLADAIIEKATREAQNSETGES